VSETPDSRPALDPTALAGLPSPYVVEVRDALPSTNAELAARAREGAEEGLVLVAEHQTAGRGRLDRSWETPPRAALTLSVLLRPAADVRRWSLLPLVAGVAVVEAVTAAGGPPLVLKWPNDVLSADGMKVAGLLVERVDTPTGAAAVVGIGLNVSTTRAELPVATAGSLVTAGMVAPDRTVLLREVVEAFARRHDQWSAPAGGHDVALRSAYLEHCDTVGREVEVQLPDGTTLRGRATGVDELGALVVDDGTAHVVRAGDVVHVRVP
jgi:BirA family transcriptional regulator, biotin operon repressor / biotin---[acetyl-CoA-carboxylase] ligase